MNKIKQAFKLLQDTGKFEPCQLHVDSDRIRITPYGTVLDYKQLHLLLAAADLFHLLPNLYSYKDECSFDLISY